MDAAAPSDNSDHSSNSIEHDTLSAADMESFRANTSDQWKCPGCGAMNIGFALTCFFCRH